ncbi:MAG: CBS domain-containing protein [Candidatus Burarchaeum sp.]|nr:CBS domain-containing protein [Candidatus Burarchaeum sp.]MDO8340116.1 CBS domain-containing protein [Candidatus Burarchaeum sp.]
MKTDIRVGEVMTRGVVTLDAAESVLEAAKVMKKNNFGSVVITRKGRAVGIITERDIVLKLVLIGKNARNTKTGDAMSRPLKTISASSTLADAAERLRNLKIKRLPVVDEKDRLVGMITDDDLVRIYPGLIDVLLEEADIQKFGKNEEFTGACEKCGVYSEELARESGKLLCSECIEEEEV